MDKTDTTEATAGPKTRIRLYLRASNLPKSLIAQGYRQPDSLARVSVVTPCRNDDEGTTQPVQGGKSAGEESDNQTLIDKTEVKLNFEYMISMFTIVTTCSSILIFITSS
jgi:hypothetical protein